MNDIISNCPLCEERSLHLIGKDKYQMQQCINCGYVTFEKFKLNDDDLSKNKAYNELTDSMKKWVKVKFNRFWTPSIFTLPTGILYPLDDDDGNVKWGYSKMVDIPEEEKEKYPNPAGGFYEKKYDIKNPKIYNKFLLALSELNNDAKNEDKL